MAESAATDIPSDASSLAPSNARNITPSGSSTGKPCSTGFLKPDSPRKRRRSGESPEPAVVSPKFSVSPPTLSAAQALIDQRKQRQAQETIFDRQTSPNPAITVISALQGRQMVSEKNPENVLSTPSGDVETSESIAVPVPSGRKPEEFRTGVAQMQRGLTPSSSVALAMEGPAPTVIDGNAIAVASPARMDESISHNEDTPASRDVQQPRRQETDPGESRSDKALTYPGPLPNIQQSDRRRNTHSGFGRESPSKSPGSNKKHQCGDDPEQDESMHGLMYTGEASHEPEKLDDENDGGSSRKGSLPSIQRHEAPNYSVTDGHVSFAARQPSWRYDRVSEAIVAKQPPARTPRTKHPPKPITQLDTALSAAAVRPEAEYAKYIVGNESTADATFRPFRRATLTLLARLTAAA
ncbi:MAG: hypothetical protein Q9178_006346 [Gyalolechia marmorata]